MLAELIHAAPYFIVAGIASGFVAGLLGIGGGIITVPVVFHWLVMQGLDKPSAYAIAVSTSLTLIVPTSIASSLSHYKLGHLNLGVFKAYSLYFVLGALAGSVLITSVRSSLFLIFFACLLFVLGLSKWRAPKQAARVPLVIHPWLGRGFAAFAGGLSSIAGVGGGTLSVPALNRVGHSMKTAVGTSSGFGLLIGLTAAVSAFIFGGKIPAQIEGVFRQLYWPALLLMAPLTIFFAPIGAVFARRLSDLVLKRCFAVLLFLMSFKMLFNAI